MGRSKFPGKPSKHTNRKRINVLPPTGETSNFDGCGSMTVDFGKENKQDEEVKENDRQTLPNDNNVINTKVSIKRRLTIKMQASLRNKNASKRSMLSKISNRKSKINNKVTKSGKLTHKTVRGYTNSCRNPSQKESNSLVGKFVLPTRSMHSSRVIKPNKRFINVDLNDSVITKRHCVKSDEEKPKIFKTNKCLNENSANELKSEKTSFTGRIVLRQARLKLHTQTPSGTEGPFSSNLNSRSPPGTVTCGVCGAVRFYRFVKQARKFNIYSCESCRKFISKMIKRQTCGKGIGTLTLVCHKGQGTCHVPPIVRSQQWKLIRSAYRARCPACWLKMCLRSFQMPLSLKHSLAELLPKNMQGPDIIFSNSLPLLWQGNIEATKSTTDDDNKQQTATVKQRPVRFRPPKVQNVITQAPINSDIKRQKIDLKGPRVKHVCRSASIVLGQPLATFGVDDKKTESQDQICVESSEDPKSEAKQIPVSATKSEYNSNCSETDSSDSDKLAVSALRREKFQRPSIFSSQIYSEKNNADRKNVNDFTNAISIDFWEGYDPDDIGQNGFCLIASEPFPMPAICFLCGSAGRDPLLYCSICCEPYHSFCLEQIPSLNNNNTRCCLWLCPRCTICSECDQTDRQKMNCQKCLKSYHPECFNKKWNSDDRPTVCSKCLRCKNCGIENIIKLVGNTPLCVTCFKLRKKSNFCPMCKHCYDDSDCCAKMMECEKCGKWVHAKCEQLSEEQYQILSALPESIKYFCKICSKDSVPQWRQAVEFELHSSFNHVLRLLSKNKTARNILKWSPLNNHTQSSKAITNVKKLQFSKEEFEDNNNSNKNIADINKIYSFEENEKLENELKISSISLSVVDIKHKLNSNEFCSVKEFSREMEEALKHTNSEQLLKIYKSIFHTIFPWYEAIKSEDAAEHLEEETLENKVITSVPSEKEEKITEVDVSVPDNRICSFCKSVGDGLNHQESRLLYCGQNEWVHANCALWSSEVYEEIDGSLQNVHSALSRGRLIRCSSCKLKGASVGCCFKGCYETFHFQCARLTNCKFLHDKTVYCSTHEIPKDSNVLISQKEFDIHRSVYVELDKKRRKFAEIEKVNFMIGSLCVTNLGKIHPLISDTVEAIIPMGFICSRLYWSTVEPWKLIPYNISTSMLNANSSTLYVDKNFTVDHALPKAVVEKKIKELCIWQREIDRKKSDLLEFDDDEEPQNGADLLSPELTDAILEELPNDLLDGISVQDLFPKLMSCDDLISNDYKSDVNCTESNELFKKTELEDDDIKMRKSENTPQNKFDLINKSKFQQRPCSLTVSCKVDRTLSPAIKKRKIAGTTRDVYFHLLQVDGNFDDSSSSECSSPTGEHHIDPWSEEPVTCEKCQCTYRTQASYKRHLDTCEVICTSESDSEIPEIDTSQPQDVLVNGPTTIMENSTVLVKETTQPLILTSYESFQNEIRTSVLNTQTFVTSKSTELFSVPQRQEVLIQNVPQPIEPKPVLQALPINTMGSVAVNTDTAHTDHRFTLNHHHPSITINEPISISNNQHTQFCVNQTVPLCVNQQLTSLPVNQTSLLNEGNPLISINQGSISINQLNQPNTLEFQPQSVTIQSVPFSNNVTPILNMTHQNQFTLNGKLITNPLMQTVNVPNTQWVKQIAKPTIVTQKPIKARNRSRTIAAKRQNNLYDDDNTIILPNATVTGPSVIVQHLPSTNFVPTFVDAFHQQTGQNLQYVTAIAPQPTQPILQLQPEGNLINLVPGLQPTTMIIQQPRVIENQLVLDSNGSLGWSTQSTVQPVYYGFETIVQNTVMQSQQFLPTTVPGVLTANSSYSTTTQVFQTSKLEPVLDVASNSFVLVNPGQLVQNSPAIEVTPQYSPQNLNSLNIITQPSHSQQPIKYSQTITPQKPIMPTSTIQNTNSITLPTAPFVQEQGIPTNVVIPTPKQTVTNQCRPMNRVLPMPTNMIKEQKKVIVEDTKKLLIEDTKKPIQIPTTEEVKQILKTEEITKPIKQTESLIKKQIELENKIVKTIEAVLKPPVTQQPLEILPPPPTIKEVPSLIPVIKTVQQTDDTSKIPEIKPTPEVIIQKAVDGAVGEKQTTIIQKPIEKENKLKLKNDTSLKLIFQKQGQDGIYKISNNFSSKHPLQPVAPLKAFKPNNNQLVWPLGPKENKQDQKPNPLIDEKLDNIETQNISKNSGSSKKENENSSAILYTIETQDGFKYSSTSIADLWDKVFEAVQNARLSHNMPPLPREAGNIFNNIQTLGLKSSGLKYLIEQLPGATKCSKYKPSFNFQPHVGELVDEYSSTGHYYGSIRCAPYDTRKSETYDMFGWLASKHRKPEEVSFETLELVPRRGSVTNLPMAMRFRQLKLTSKYSVGVYRSSIHGRGLFCLHDIEAGEMVIEYAGEVIRSILTDKREKYYNTKGIGCYMFRVDDNFVVDATMKGNAARFINHSCDPNCYSRVVEILGHKHIIIFALRRIMSGEELTYDYKFPFEEDKIPCTCGSRKCRKFLN